MNNKYLTFTEEALVKTFLAIILGFILFGFFAFAQTTTTTMPVATSQVSSLATAWTWLQANYVGIIAIITSVTTVLSEAIPMISNKNWVGIIDLIMNFKKPTV